MSAAVQNSDYSILAIYLIRSMGTSTRFFVYLFLFFFFIIIIYLILFCGGGHN